MEQTSNQWIHTVAGFHAKNVNKLIHKAIRVDNTFWITLKTTCLTVPNLHE